MKFAFSIFIVVLAGVVPCRAQTNFSYDPEKKIAGRPYFADPAISPDGTQIAFSSGGDIWTVSVKGGEARLLISHPAYESRPVYSPDGRWLAFNSSRTGNGDVYVMNLSTSEIRRITYDDGNEDVNSWSPDSKYIYFSTASHDINAMRDIYRVKAEGGTPMPVSNSRYMMEFFSNPSPDGKTVAFTARGVAYGQWWRNGHSHLDESEIWLWKEDRAREGGADPGSASDAVGGAKSAAAPFERVTEGGAKELWPMWSKDGSTIYYVSDRSGAANLWSKSLSGGGAAGGGSAAKQLTNFTKGRVLWPSISGNGQTIVYERDFAIWKYDVGSGKTEMVAINRVGTPSAAERERGRPEPLRDTRLSPDGKKMAFVSHGEVFVAAAATGGEAFRVTHTGANESQLAWAPNSNLLSYISDRDEVSHIYTYNFITHKEGRVTDDAHDDAAPVYSPDGKLLAFVRDSKELHVLDLATHEDKKLAKGYMGRPPLGATSVKWSPDGKWIAFTAYGVKGFRNVNVVAVGDGGVAKGEGAGAAGGSGAAVPVSFLANSFGGNISWSPDGRYILFNTRQRTETSNVARVDLVSPRLRFTEDQLQELFTDTAMTPGVSAPGAAVPGTAAPGGDTSSRAGRGRLGRRPPVTTRIQFEGIRERLSLLPLGGLDVNDISISPDGNQLLITGTAAGIVNLYLYTLNESVRGEGGGRAAGGGGGGGGSALRQLTSTPGGKSEAQFSADGKEVYYLSQGSIESISLDGKITKPLSVRPEMEVDFNTEKVEVFRQAWQAQRKGYADADMNGVDWNGVYKEYEPLAAGAATPDELRRILSLMVGELNSSHSGVAGGGGAVPAVTGRLGLVFDRGTYEEKGQFKIAEVVYQSPADLAGIHVGELLVAINGKPLAAGDNIDEVLENTVGHKTELTVKGGGADGRVVSVKPVNLATEKGLLYRQWVKQEREYVRKLSNGRLGYVHMNDMGQESLDQLYIDLDAENQAREGVVVDVRNNNGGFVNAYALDVLARRPYLTMTNRGMAGGPARAQLGQRALESPTILLTNQHSLSDAEDFTEGYRTLGLGKVVGEPTGGWIIFTGSVTLIDGSTVRLPFSKITDHEGKNMELHPRPVDIAVSNPIGQAAGKDAQLETAVQELLKEVDAKKGK